MITFLTWFHVVAAVSWIGGMVFLSLVLVPVLRNPAVAPHRGLLFPLVARQFRVVGWGAMGILLASGPVLAAARGIDPGVPSTWPTIFWIKMVLVAVLVGLSALHDLSVGPRVSGILRKPVGDRTPFEGQLVRWAPFLARCSLVLALSVLYCAVHLVRV